jgi:4-amino-4-deoxy-L-arabinose transferase-like glycosyltransferase
MKQGSNLKRFFQHKYSFLFIILLIGAFFRFYHLGRLPISGDESFHALAVKGILNYGVPKMPNGNLYLRSTPLLYLQALSFEILGQDEWALRFPTALFGTLNIILVYIMVSTYTRSTALSIIASLLFCLSPWAIATARICRMYEVVATFAMLTFTLWHLWYYSKKTILLPLILITLIALLLHKLMILPMIVFIIPLFLNQGTTYQKAISIATFLFISSMWYLRYIIQPF